MTPEPIRFALGERTLWTAWRPLVPVAYTLPDLLDARTVPLPALGEADGWIVRSMPGAAVPARDRALLGLERQRYPRHFIRLDGDWDGYWNGFSARTRSTLKRKRARWIDAAGGLDVRCYHTPAAVDAFARAAGALSARTYQHRLLGAGLPTDAAAVAVMRACAAAGDLRGFILFHRGEPAAFLYLPVSEGVVRYRHLGYDPALAALSPGTVLQVEALRQLFDEPALRLFDFTEGDGDHKRLFGREAVACVDRLLLRRTWRNRALLAGLAGWDGAVGGIGGIAARTGAKSAMKRWLRR